MSEPIDVIEDGLKVLLDEDHITEVRKKAEKEYANFTDEQIKALRHKCKTDLFFLSYGILGNTRLSPNLHGHLCQWLKATEHRQYREVLLPRGHFKSTVITVSDTVQTILPDDEASSIYPKSLGPNCHVLIGHEVKDIAAGFLYGITGHFVGNPLLMGLFPECVPTNKIQRINKYELELPRSTIRPEPTIAVLGVGGKSQGMHFNKLLLDDLIGDKARESATEMQTAKDWFDNIQAFFSKFGEDQFILVGTRWGKNDLYDHVHKMYGDQIVKYIRPVEELKDGKKTAIFPEEFTLDKLSILRKNRKVFTAQYLNNPQEGGGKFEKHWKKYYTWVDGWRIKVINGGVSSNSYGASLDKQVENTIYLNSCDIIILIDPATSGDTGFIITATDRTNKTYVLEAYKGTLQPPVLIEKIFRDVDRWRPRLVAIEEVIFSKVYKPYLEAEMRLRGKNFHVEMVKTGQRQKSIRVDGLANYFSASQIYFNEGQTDLIEEYDGYGTNDDYHLLDALAYGPGLWRSGTTKLSMESNQKAIDAVMARRNVQTGYSHIKYGGTDK